MINIILWILAIFGIIQLFIQSISLRNYQNSTNENTYFILTVLNQESTVEDLIKSVVWSMPINCLKVIDLGSTDNTLMIVEKMQKDYDCIEIEEIDFLEKLRNDYVGTIHELSAEKGKLCSSVNNEIS